MVAVSSNCTKSFGFRGEVLLGEGVLEVNAQENIL